jgi:biotin-(acetyl-CoA carboxylase) ligase
VRQEYRITFDKVVGGLDPKGTPRTWKIDDIREKAAQVDHLQGLKKSDIDKKHLQGTATELDADGRLIVRATDGVDHVVAAGDVTHARLA